MGDAWSVERGFLRPLPEPVPETDTHLEARVSKDCFVRVGDADYSVPPGLSGRRVAVRLDPVSIPPGQSSQGNPSRPQGA